jgi:hypothetical protein
MSTQHFFMPLVVVGLVVLTLVLSGIARRYQQRQAARRSVVNRMETGIRLIEETLRDLQSFPLATTLRQTLRQDVLRRYQMIGQIYRTYPRLGEQLKEAEARLAAESDVAVGNVPEITDESEVATFIDKLDELSVFVEGPHLLSPPIFDKRKRFVFQLGEIRAELLSKFHHAQFRQKHQAGELSAAQDHLRSLMETLKTRGPNTEKVLDLYNQAEEEFNVSLRRVDSALPETALKAS